MKTISVAIALQSGEMASRLIGLVEGHPLLDFCGAARSLPDLSRLLDKFHPQVLLISPSILEELESIPESGEARVLSAPLSFLLTNPEMTWGEKELSRILRQPLRYCGIIDRDASGEEELFNQIKYKVDLYSPTASPRFSSLNGEPVHHQLNSLIAVMGSKGGVGGTLISCILASSLAAAGRRVLLMDMDSGLSQLLHIKPRGEGKTVLDLLPMAEEISWDLVRLSIHRHAAGFHLLPYGLKPEERTLPEGIVSQTFLRNLLFLFDVVVLDYPRPSTRDYLTLLNHSPISLLVSLPDTLSANCARRTVASLRRSGLDLRHLRLIVNRCGPHHALRPEELARAIGVELLAQLPEDERSGMDFAELGEVPRGDSHLGRAVAEMAASLGFETAQVRKPPALQRLRGLRKLADRDLSFGGQT